MRPGAKIPARRVKLFRNARNQAVRIPREFELPGEDAIVRKEGPQLVIEPGGRGPLLALLAGLQPLKVVFPPTEELPHEAAEF